MDDNNRIKFDFFSDILNINNISDNNNLYNIIKNCGLFLYEMLGGKMSFNENDININNINNILYPENVSKDAINLVENMININNKENFGFNDIKSHSWFNLVEPKMRPGIIYNTNKIPVDENILDKIEQMGYDKKSCKKSIFEDKYDSLMAIYLLVLNKYINEGNESIADLFSDKYLAYINDNKNLLDTTKKESSQIKDNILYNYERNSKNINNYNKSNKEKKLFSSLIRRRRNGNDSNIMSESLNLNDFFSSNDLTIINNNISEILDSKNETIGFEQINTSRMFQSNIYNNNPNFDSNLFLSTNEEKLSSKNMTSNKNKNVSNNNKFIKIKRKKKKEVNIKKPNIEEIINKRILKNKENNSKEKNDKAFHSLKIIEKKSNINSKNSNIESNLKPNKNSKETEIKENDIKNNDFNSINNNFIDYLPSTPKKIKIIQKSKDINNNYFNNTERKKHNLLINNNTSLISEESLDNKMKNNLEKKLKEDIAYFEKDLNILDNLFNLNINKNGIYIKLLADKLIQTTNFNDICSNNIIGLEKYKKSLLLISELLNENNNDKLSELNQQNIEKILEDKDDYIISEQLLNNKYFSSFIEMKVEKKI